MKLNNSIYNGIIALKNQLADSIAEQNSILDALTNAIQVDFEDAISLAEKVEIPTRVLTLNTGDTLQISKSANTNEINFYYKNIIADIGYTNEIYYSPTFSQLASRLNAPRMFTERIIDGVDVNPTFSVKDVFISLAEGEATNEAVAKVNELFLLNPNVSNSDIIAAINTVKGGVSPDLNTLKTNILNSSIEGKVSNYGWLTVVSNMCSESKDVVDEGSLTVTDENFFALQTFMQTVLQVASVLLSAVLTVLSAIFGGLLSILGVVFQSIISLFSSTFDTDYDFKANVSYPGIKGTYFAGVDSTISDIANVGSNVALRIVQGSEDIFLFKQPSGTPNVYNVFVQSQPTLVFHPNRLISFLRNHYTATIVHPVELNQYITCLKLDKRLNINYDDALPDEDASDYPFLKVDDYIKMGTDKTFMINALKANVIMSVLTRCVNLTLSKTDVTIYTDDNMPSNYLGKGLKLLQYSFIDVSLSAADVWNKYSNQDLRDIVTGIRNMIDFENNLYHLVDYDGGWLFNLWDAQFYTRPLHTIKYANNNNNAISVSNGVLTINEDLRDYQTDSIATENMISIPSLDNAQVIAALAVIAGIIASTVVVGKKLNASLKAKKQLRQTKRLSELNSKRDAYLANPTKENADSYKRAMSSYNFKASLFGWGSYDAANGWLNPPDSTGISSTDNIDNLIKINTGISGIRSLITSE